MLGMIRRWLGRTDIDDKIVAALSDAIKDGVTASLQEYVDAATKEALKWSVSIDYDRIEKAIAQAGRKTAVECQPVDVDYDRIIDGVVARLLPAIEAIPAGSPGPAGQDGRDGRDAPGAEPPTKEAGQ